LLPALARARESARRASCQNNLKEMGLVCKMYSNEDPGERFPTIQRWENGDGGACERRGSPDFIFDGLSVYPEYLNDPWIMLCPSDPNAITNTQTNGGWYVDSDVQRAQIDPCRFNAESYNYFSWAILDRFWLLNPTRVNAENFALLSDIDPVFLASFYEAVDDMDTEWRNGSPPSGDAFDQDLPCTRGTVYRLREGIERFLITDINNPAQQAQAQSTVFVVMDDIQYKVEFMNHVPGGGNVLYMDGHVDFIRYPGDTPFSRGWAVLLTEAMDLIP